MSIANVRPYFQNIMNSLGYKEHRDVLNYLNIPRTLINKSYHIETQGISSSAAEHQTIYTYIYNVVVRIFKHSYNDPVGSLQEMEEQICKIHNEILKESNRISGVLLDVIPGFINYQAISIDNDNLLVGELNFSAKIKIRYT